MRFGVALPVDVPGLTETVLFQWVNRIEAGPFDTISVIDEIVMPQLESLTTLAAVAALTTRVRLMTNVIGSPARNTALLAKQAATIDVLSGGRLSLGLGVGELVDDFAVSGADFADRGARFDQQLTELKRIWNGEPVGDTGRGIGPAPVQPGGPELLLGGWAPRALRRIGRFADGYAGAVLTEELLTDEHYQIALKSWRDEGRDGRPRHVQSVYFALGKESDAQREAHLRAAYAGSPAYDLQAIAAMIPTNEDDLRRMVERIEGIGADELLFHPLSADIDQIERLEQALS
jgi:alkanesulfonate monooxygenase SsuD/methylene tetrahydromethanopterin reductase-like flavin-dependent oxidoreductase (luciferase family)